MSVIDELARHNAEWAAGRAPTDLPPPPARKVAVVTCMDARLDPAEALGLQPGDAHILRNAGAVVTDDVVRSLMVSQRLLGTEEVMVVGHTGCGLLLVTDEEVKSAVEAETGLRPPFAVETFRDVDIEVRQSLGRLRASPFLPHRDAVRGFVYDVVTGQLREVAAPAAGGS